MWNQDVICWRTELVVTSSWRNYCKQQKPQPKFGAEVFERGSVRGHTLRKNVCGTNRLEQRMPVSRIADLSLAEIKHPLPLHRVWQPPLWPDFFCMARLARGSVWEPQLSFHPVPLERKLKRQGFFWHNALWHIIHRSDQRAPVHNSHFKAVLNKILHSFESTNKWLKL